MIALQGCWERIEPHRFAKIREGHCFIDLKYVWVQMGAAIVAYIARIIAIRCLRR